MSELTPLTGEALNTLRGDFAQSGTNRLAMNAVTAAGIDKVARNYDRARLMQRRFSTIVDNGEATHQDRSGRCWLFSSLNVARFVAKKNMNLKEFEFSQNYAMYYDKLERVNYFLKDGGRSGGCRRAFRLPPDAAPARRRDGRWRPVDHGHERVQEVRRCAQGPVPGDRILQEHR